MLGLKTRRKKASANPPLYAYCIQPHRANEVETADFGGRRASVRTSNSASEPTGRRQPMSKIESKIKIETPRSRRRSAVTDIERDAKPGG